MNIEGLISVEEIDASIVKNVALYARC